VSSHHHPHPRETLERCALRAQLRGDPMLGTAFPAGRLLLVEQPGPWGERGLRDSRFTTDAAQALHSKAEAAGYRVQMIRRPGRTPRDALRKWALVDTRDGQESLRWGSYDEPAELIDLPFDAAPGEPDAELRPGRVWESSHVGGDRFAANVLVLPVGLLYGRVLPFAAEEFVAAAEAGEVIGALLRGRIGLPATAQAALAFAHEHLALRRRRDLRVEYATPIQDGTSTVRLHGPHGSLDVTVRVERRAAEGLTCHNPRPNQYLAYRPVAIVPVED
jgi:hypothetical protein